MSKIKIGDILEVEYGSGTNIMVVDEYYDDDDIRGHYRRDNSPAFTDASKVVRVIGNIADPEPEEDI